MATPSADSVTISGRHILNCANEQAWRSLKTPFHLGPLDQLVAPFIPVAVVFVYKASHSEPIIPFDRLQSALALLLDYYPHLTGRLGVNGDGTPEITQLGSGAELFEAQCSERLDGFAPRDGHLTLNNLPTGGNALLAPFDPTIVFSNPILTIQHTRFACGGVALGVRVLHMVFAADGIFQLVRDLAEAYRGIVKDQTPSLAPSQNRPYLSDLEMTPEERQAALHYKPALFHLESDSGATESVPAPPPPFAGRFIRFSGTELQAIKVEATGPGDAWVSTFEALAAHFYQRVYRARLKLRERDPSLGELSPPDYLSPVNLRSRIPLPPRYTPNALFTLSTCLSHDILTGPLWRVAKALHDMFRVSSINSKEEIDQTLRWLAARPDKSKIRTAFRYGNGSLMISQWNKTDMYAGPIFDSRPILVSTPFTPISLLDGLGYFLPTEEQGTDGDREAIDVCLSLSAPVWDVLDEDVEFRRFR